VLGAIEAAERSVERAEKEEIDELQQEFPDVPAAVFDAMRYRASKLAAQSINLDTASSGSIILAGAAAAVAYWLLDKTLGETMKQAWEESDLHARVKRFLLARFNAKAERIASHVKASRWPNAVNDVSVRTERRDMFLFIIVTVTTPAELTPIPSASRVANRRDA